MKIITKTYGAPPVNQSDLLRYLGDRNPSQEVFQRLSEAMKEADPVFRYRLCYCELDVRQAGEELDLGFARTASRSLKKALTGCDKILLFAATVGVGIDRLIARYGRTSPIMALCMQAYGVERIESLCDLFCGEMKERYETLGRPLRERFSPGYGDLPLQLQSDIFRTLNCPGLIGLSLTDSLLMAPTKSVTAIVGIQRPTEGDKPASSEHSDHKSANG